MYNEENLKSYSIIKVIKDYSGSSILYLFSILILISEHSRSSHRKKSNDE